MLTAPDHLLAFHVPGHGFQDLLLPHLPRDQGEADQPVVPWVLLLAVENRSDIHFPPVFRHISQLPGSIKDY